jgi:membrane protease YdiL (CAAX protease family)
MLRSVDLLPPDAPATVNGRQTIKHNPWLRLLVFGLIFAGLSFGLRFVASRVLDPLTSRGESALGQSINVVAAIIAYLFVARFIEDRKSVVELSWRRIPGLLKGMLIGAAVILVSVEVLALTGGYTIRGISALYSPWLDLVSLGVGAAVSEELFFRGMLFRSLEESLGSWTAVGVTAVLFGAAHFITPNFSVVAAIAIAIEAGLLYGAVWLATRSMWWVIGLHFAWNVVQGPLLGIPVSGNNTGGWLDAQITGPAWLTGGNYGIEASVIPMVLCALFSLWLLVQVRRGQMIVAPVWNRRKLISESHPATPVIPKEPELLVIPEEEPPLTAPRPTHVRAPEFEESIATPDTAPRPRRAL